MDAIATSATSTPWTRSWWWRVAVVLTVQLVALLVLASVTDSIWIGSVGAGVAAVLFIGFVDSILWPIAVRWTLPLMVFTVGLFSFVLNGAMLWLGSILVDGFEIRSLWSGMLIALVIGTCSGVVGSWLRLDDDESWQRLVQRRAFRTQDRVERTDVPGVLFIQIDGLSYDVLREAMARGDAPTMATLVASGHHLVPWECDLSSQTGAMQAGILLGNNSDMPAFRWYDKQSGQVLVSNNPRDAALIEQTQSSGRGLLADGGASRGNVFSGDAEDVLFTFSHLHRPSASRSLVSLFATPHGLLRLMGLFAADVRRERRAARVARRENIQPAGHRGGVYPLLRAAVTVGLAEITSATLAGDIARGIPTVYCDFVGYDEVAHHSGIRRPESFDTLRRIDDRLRRLILTLPAAPRPYEMIVLSDHGQTQGATFLQRYGETLEDVVRRLSGGTEVVAPDTVTEGWGNVNGVLTDLANDESSFASRMVRRTLRRRIRDDEVEIGPAGHVRLEGLDDEIIVLASGSLGLVSFAGLEGRATLPEIEQHYPGLVAGIANHPGVGFVMVRPAVGESAIAVGRNGVHHLGSGEVEGVDPLIPFGPNAAIHLLRTDGFANCPDLVVNSFFDPETQQGAAFEELIGFHGGLGGLQTTPFLLAPPVCGVPGLPIVGAERVHELLRSWVAEIRSAVSIESFR